MTEEQRKRPTPGDDEADAGKPPHLDESVRRIGKAGRAVLGSGRDTGRALRKLLSADLALARSALGRALAWCAVAIIFGASAWLLVMGATVAVLQAVGLSWLVSISIAAGISLAVTGLAGWRVMVFFDLAGLHATRRQLTRLGLFNEDDDDEDGEETHGTRPPPASTGGSGDGAGHGAAPGAAAGTGAAVGAGLRSGTR